MTQEKEGRFAEDARPRSRVRPRDQHEQTTGEAIKVPRMNLARQVTYFRSLLKSAQDEAIGGWKSSDVDNALRWAELMDRKRQLRGEQVVPWSHPMQELLTTLFSNPRIGNAHMQGIAKLKDGARSQLVDVLSEKLRQRGEHVALKDALGKLDAKVPQLLMERSRARILKIQHMRLLKTEGEAQLIHQLERMMEKHELCTVELLCLELACDIGPSDRLDQILADKLICALDKRTEESDPSTALWFGLREDTLSAASSHSLRFFRAYVSARLEREQQDSGGSHTGEPSSFLPHKILTQLAQSIVPLQKVLKLIAQENAKPFTR
mmetsp:Transcript_3743/g.11150  ORF Transcript_3743/g.11150 Transcript_3743/m.11150 type:complete len:322 (+) Transcript_3743:107-1072(+)